MLIQAFRPGVMDRLGLGPNQVRARNPKLSYTSISGYGADDDRRGVDTSVQGESGWMSVTGEPDGLPTLIGAFPIDTATGHITAQAVLAALLNRERRGHGECVEVSRYDVGCHLHAHDFTDYLMNGRVAQRVGNHLGLNTPSGLFATADGTIVLAAYFRQHWDVLLDVLGDDTLRDDPRLATPRERFVHRGELVEAIERTTRTRTTAEWIREFDRAWLTTGRVLDTGQVVESDEFARNRLELRIEPPGGRRIRTLRGPVRSGPVRSGPVVHAGQRAAGTAVGRTPDPVETDPRPTDHELEHQ